MSEDSNSSNMTIDGNVILPSEEKKEASIDDVNSPNDEVNSVDRSQSDLPQPVRGGEGFS